MTTTAHPRLFRVKTVSGVETHMRILHDTADGYQILITSRTDGRERTSEEFISRELVESCLRTGYLTEVAQNSAIGAAR
ncbi:hypothetical protein [Salinispira pacifica]